MHHIHDDVYDKIHSELDKVGLLMFHMNKNLMDVYFLRRALDKDYVKNIVVYTGSDHTFMYMNFLTKYYGFRFTHLNYLNISPNDDPKKIYDIILKGDLMDMREILFPLFIEQCIDVSDYPKNFD